jgi:hypothetical protein
MQIELQITVLNYDEAGQHSTTLRRPVPENAQIARSGDLVAANENWPPVPVDHVVWNDKLAHAVVVLAAVDADDVGPGTVALEILHAAGWREIAEESIPSSDMAATVPGID